MDERLGLEREDVFSTGGGAQFVIAQCAEDASPRRAHSAFEREVDQREKHDAKAEVDVLIVSGVDDAGQRLWNAAQDARPVDEPGLFDRDAALAFSFARPGVSRESACDP